MWEDEPLEGFVVRARIPKDVPSVAEALARAVEEVEEQGTSQVTAETLTS